MMMELLVYVSVFALGLLSGWAGNNWLKTRQEVVDRQLAKAASKAKRSASAKNAAQKRLKGVGDAESAVKAANGAIGRFEYKTESSLREQK